MTEFPDECRLGGLHVWVLSLSDQIERCKCGTARFAVLRPRDERRERIATAVLAGLMANTDAATDAPANLAKWSIEQADALIAALDAPPESK